MTLLTLLLALGAGVGSILAPCVLPMLPVYVAYLTGEDGRASAGRRLFGAACFVLGFAAVFVLAFYLLRSLVAPARVVILAVFGVALLVLAVKRLGWLRLGFLDHPLRLTQAPGHGPAAGAVLGASLAFGWTPCMGPLLAAVLGQAVLEQTSTLGLATVVTYVAGLGAPFLAIAVFTGRSRAWLDFVGAHRRPLDAASSLVLVLIGVLLLTNNFAWLDRLSTVAAVPPLGR